MVDKPKTWPYLRSVILLGTVGILAGWANSRLDNVLLLLLMGWMLTLAVLQLEQLVRLSLFQVRTFQDQLQLITGFLSPTELLAATFTMTLFSFIAYFTSKHHWFLLAHGTWWGLVTLRQLTRLGR